MCQVHCGYLRAKKYFEDNAANKANVSVTGFGGSNRVERQKIL